MTRYWTRSIPATLTLLVLAACRPQAAAPVCPPAPVAESPPLPRLAGDDERQAEMDRKLDLLITKVESLEQKMAAAQARAAERASAAESAAVYAVDIAGDPFLGAADAKVTIVKASEYACPFCFRVEPVLEQLLKDYSGQIKIVYKDYIVHPAAATVPAHAACAAHQQGKFAEYNKALWEQAFGKDTTEPKMMELAARLKLDVVRFKADMNSDKCKDDVVADQRALSAMGVSGTPAFFINGRFLSGARPIEQFKALVDEELKKAGELIGKNGVTAKNYYEKVVLGTGLKSL